MHKCDRLPQMAFPTIATLMVPISTAKGQGLRRNKHKKPQYPHLISPDSSTKSNEKRCPSPLALDQRRMSDL